jgi:hypothetical protein
MKSEERTGWLSGLWDTMGYDGSEAEVSSHVLGLVGLVLCASFVVCLVLHVGGDDQIG